MRLVNSLLAFLFPPRESELLIAPLAASDMHTCFKPVIENEVYTLSSFKNPVVRACVHEIKFHNNEKGAVLLAELLRLWAASHVREKTLVVPIPLSAKRYRERGYNQVARVAKHACARDKKLILSPNLLTRTRNTKAQTSLNREARLLNIEGAFAVSGNRASEMIRGAHILVLDDVYTTGATMHAAKVALLPHHPASVTCVALAH